MFMSFCHGVTVLILLVLEFMGHKVRICYYPLSSTQVLAMVDGIACAVNVARRNSPTNCVSMMHTVLQEVSAV